MHWALIVWGGWLGHQPKEVAEIFRRVLVEEGFSVEVSDTLDALRDEAALRQLSLIVPVWTMGKILPEQCNPVFCGSAAARRAWGWRGVTGECTIRSAKIPNGSS